MNLIYNSEAFYVVQYPPRETQEEPRLPREPEEALVGRPAAAATPVPAHPPASDGAERGFSMQIGSFEIVDKTSRREIYLDGQLAEVFRRNVEELMKKSPSVEEIDAFLDDLCAFSHQRLTLQ